MIIMKDRQIKKQGSNKNNRAGGKCTTVLYQLPLVGFSPYSRAEVDGKSDALDSIQLSPLQNLSPSILKKNTMHQTGVLDNLKNMKRLSFLNF